MEEKIAQLEVFIGLKNHAEELFRLFSPLVGVS